MHHTALRAIAVQALVAWPTTYQLDAGSTGSGGVLVTGGAGALGQLVTSWLAKCSTSPSAAGQANSVVPHLPRAIPTTRCSAAW